MYTSIPYDKGWDVYIDGNKSAITPICGGALSGVLVEAGEHEITFKYTPQGPGAGIAISVICLLAFTALVFQDNIKALILSAKKPQKK